MPSKSALRKLVRNRLDEVARRINAALQGRDLDPLEPVLTRIGRGGALPHWYQGLRKNGTLPNLDGKTVGSVVEMLLVGVLETGLFHDLGVGPLRINPARGVDLPELDLGVKSPSRNYCTSEPFYSAYERLLGIDHDVVVLLTDYQDSKRRPPLRLQIVGQRYLGKTQVADENLCRIARKVRRRLVAENETWAKKVFRFLAYVNQSDWLGKQLLELVDVLNRDVAIRRKVEAAGDDFERKNCDAARRGRPLIPETDLLALRRIPAVSPLRFGVMDAADNWVIETQKEAGRAPSENEWGRLLRGSLDGRIGMSFALQWRYNFGRLFRPADDDRHPDDAHS